MKRKGGRKQDLVKFFLELGVLKRLPRSGWVQVGVQNPETVGSHSFRTALISWALAKFLNADTNKVVKMGLIHDLEEARTGDLNMVNKRYHLNDKKTKAYTDVLKSSPFAIEGLVLIAELSMGKTAEAKIVNDADKLDLFLQAFEYKSAGLKSADKFMRSSKKELKLKVSKDLARQIEKGDLVWWYP